MSRDSWAAALLGLGVVPRNLDPQALNLPLGEVTAAMERLVREIETAVATVPEYSDFLARISR